jgi:nucleotide-binding universal stress UspA family protein
MYARILLCTDGSPDAEVAGDYAIWLAHKLHASLQALYVTDIRLLEGPWLADLSGAFGAQPYPNLMPKVEEIQRQKADTILGAVAERCAQHNVACEVAHETGGLVPTMLQYEQAADLVVLGQHGEHAQWAGDMLGSSVERMVRASVRPCLVTPDEFRQIQCLLIAYDGSGESAKALRVGLQLAGRLEATVNLVTICQREQAEQGTNVLQQAQRQAVEQKLVVHAQLLHGDAETEILNERLKVGADLIVMGAYGHTRIREWVVGSTTSQIIRQSPVPVLLARGG